MADTRSAMLDPAKPQAFTRQALSGAPRFDAVLAVRPCARSQHFYVHHLPSAAAPDAARPADARATEGAGSGELSTDDQRPVASPVDESSWRLGMIVPKRHAKRSVTRSLVKRRIRAQWAARLATMPAGDWVVRLMTPLDRKTWPSAASEVLAGMISAELATVLDAAVLRARQGPQPARRPRSGEAKSKPGVKPCTTSTTTTTSAPAPRSPQAGADHG